MNFALHYFKVLGSGAVAFFLSTLVLVVAMPGSPYWSLGFSALLTALVVASATFQKPVEVKEHL